MATGDSKTPATGPRPDPSTSPPIDTTTHRRSRRSIAVPALALVVWTLFVWVGRIRNVAADDDLEGFSAIWRLGLASVFSLSALALSAATIGWLRSADGLATPSGLLRATGTWLAGFGIVVWTIRGIDIALGEHSVPFVVVHTVLALVTIALGVVVLRSLRSSWALA